LALELRGDFDARMLRLAAKGSKNGPQARRLLALAAIYEGATRTSPLCSSRCASRQPLAARERFFSPSVTAAFPASPLASAMALRSQKSRDHARPSSTDCRNSSCYPCHVKAILGPTPQEAAASRLRPVAMASAISRPIPGRWGGSCLGDRQCVWVCGRGWAWTDPFITGPE